MLDDVNLIHNSQILSNSLGITFSHLSWFFLCSSSQLDVIETTYYFLVRIFKILILNLKNLSRCVMQIQVMSQKYNSRVILKQIWQIKQRHSWSKKGPKTLWPQEKTAFENCLQLASHMPLSMFTHVQSTEFLTYSVQKLIFNETSNLLTHFLALFPGFGSFVAPSIKTEKD